jgi:transposase-like protein
VSDGDTAILDAIVPLTRLRFLRFRKPNRVSDGDASSPRGPAERPAAQVESLPRDLKAIVVEFRRRTLLPLDDVLGCLRETIPTLSRSALHRCLVRHGISRLPQPEEKASKRERFAETAIGYVHIDVCELRLAEGKLFMFLAIDRISKFTHVAFLDANTKLNGAAFLREGSRPSRTRSTPC